MNEESEPFALPSGTRVGSVGLRVGSIERVAGFYRDALGLRLDRAGDDARLHAGGEALLCLREDADAPERGREEAGLFHVAVRVPDRAALADALDRIRDRGVRLTGASDHLVSEALYLQDPEGNGVEIYRDRPREEWPRTDDGRVEMDTLPLDLDDLLADAAAGDRFPEGTDVGHVHLEVTDLAEAEAFYADDLGLDVRARYGDAASFLAAGDYHHHVGLNVWNGRSAAVADGRGLAWFELVVPDDGTLPALRSRLEERGRDVRGEDGRAVVTDPDGIAVQLSTDPA